MLQVCLSRCCICIHSYIASVLSGCYVYVAMLFKCSCVFLQVFQLMFQTFYLCLYACCKCCIWMLHILHWLYTCVDKSVYFKCFDCFKRMLQVFYLDVAYATVPIHICRRQRWYPRGTAVPACTKLGMEHEAAIEHEAACMLGCFLSPSLLSLAGCFQLAAS
jgi:hypothetical protein